MKKIMKNMVSLQVIMAMLVTLIPIMANASTNISVGEYVRMGTYNGQPILWRCVDIDANGPLMLSDEVLCYKAFDAPTSLNSKTGSHSRRDGALGSNYWADSNIRSWLNSTAEAGKVEWLCGNPPTYDALESALSGMGNTAYDQEAGFLSNFTQGERDVMKEVSQKSIVSSAEIEKRVYTMGSVVYRRNYEDYPQSLGDYDNAYAEYVTDKMFLMDIKQLQAVYNNTSILGTIPYASGDIPYCSAAGNYWLRTPDSDDCHVCATEVVGGLSLGQVAAYYADDTKYYGYGVRPAFYLDTAATAVSGSGTKSAPYIYNANAVSTPTIAPTSSPTTAPTSNPTAAPTSSPTTAPTSSPTAAPTSTPPASSHSYVINNLSLKTSNGTALSNVNSIPSNTGFIVNTSFTKVRQRNESDYIFAAVYSTSGKLLSLDYVQANFADNYTYDIGFYVPPQTEQIGKVKAFIWNKFGDMTPLADSKEL